MWWRAPSPGGSVRGDDQQRDVVLEVAGREIDNRVSDRFLQLLGRHRAVGGDRFDEPLFAELLFAAPRFRDAVGEKDEAIAGVQRDRRALMFVVAEEAAE